MFLGKTVQVCRAANSTTHSPHPCSVSHLACVPILCPLSWESPLLPSLSSTRLCEEKPHHIWVFPSVHFLPVLKLLKQTRAASQSQNKQQNPCGQAGTELLDTAASSLGKGDATLPSLGGQSHWLEAAACATRCQHSLSCLMQAGL